jgi:acetyl-CoA acetyltransferase
VIEMDSNSFRDKTAIVGIGTTEISKNSHRSVLTMITQAATLALDDAGLTIADIDGIVCSDMDTVAPYTLASALGATDIAYWAQTGPGGVAPCMMMGLAAGAILSGQAKAVLAYRGLNGRSEMRFGAVAAEGNAVVGGQTSFDEFYAPHGLLTPGHLFAMMARRHFLEYGTTSEHLAEVAMTCRQNAQRNPDALMRDKALTREDYMAGRMISDPLRIFDLCLETDNAAAVVITSTDRAKDLRKRPVLIRAVAGGAPSDPRPGPMFPMVTRDDITELGGQRAAKTLWNRAGVGPEDMDIAQLYDCFSIGVLLQLEAYGFCKKGEAGPFVASGAIRREGSIPINNGGGHLSEGYIHGMNHITQAVRQLRGEALGATQIPDAELSLVTGGPLPFGSACVLRRAA